MNKIMISSQRLKYSAQTSNFGSANNLAPKVKFQKLQPEMGFQVSAICLVLFIHLMNPSHVSAADSDHTKETVASLALLDIKNQISDDPNGILNSWNTSQHHCLWKGITCDTQNQSVTGLNLFGQNLFGTISQQIGNLTSLKSINLRNNRFYGDIPREVGRLFQLQYLNISNNSLGGEIPVNLGNCSELKILDANMNKLVGAIPFALEFLAKLEGLFIGKNNLSGEIPKSIGNLTSLRHLYLSQNNLEGHLPEELGKLSSLYSLGLSTNFFTDVIPTSLFNVSTLAGIAAVDNFLEGTLPQSIGLTLPILQEFFMGNNRLEGAIPVSLTNASLLTSLDVGGNRFTGKVPTSFGLMSNLQRLNLQYNFLGSNSTGDLDFIASLANCSNLHSLILSNNTLGGSLPDLIGNLSINMVQIDLGLNQISGEIPPGLGNLPNLYLLGMDHNLFSGSIPSFFHRFHNLQKLFLNNNQLSSQIPPSLLNLSSLYGLYLSDNKLEGNIPRILAESGSLRELILSGNYLNGSIPEETFSFLSTLTFLNLSNNFFSGSIPTQIQLLKNMYTLDISRNKLSGKIPGVLSSCTSLEYIYMQGNLFQGEIPPKLASLKSIRILDLSENKLTGNIPKDLNTLPFVQSMNLSFNDLEGPVPTNGPFSNASSISLEGNSKLCGGIPELKLQLCSEGKERKRTKLSPGFIALIIIMSLILIVVILFCIFYFGSTRQRRKPCIETETFSGISYQDLHTATEGFSSDNLIGSGSFGTVYKGTLDQKNFVAVKVLDLQKAGASKSFLAECLALRNIRHRNLVKVITCCSTADHQGREFKALVYEFMPNGDLDMWLHRKPENGRTGYEVHRDHLSLVQRLNIAMDVAYALDYLHNQCETPFVHCDLKPCNVLLDNELNAHVGDFGLARCLSQNASNLSHQQTSSVGVNGTVGYAAPEYGMGGVASTRGDVYSYGILLLEMFTGRRPSDVLFGGELTLHEYVKAGVSEAVKVVDPSVLFVLSEGENCETKSTKRNKEAKCLGALLDIALSCSSHVPKERMDMKNVVRELNSIRNALSNEY